MRLKRERFPDGRVVTRGVITNDELRKKFNIPADAEIAIAIPMRGEPGKVLPAAFITVGNTADDDVHAFNVRWERIS